MKKRVLKGICAALALSMLVACGSKENMDSSSFKSVQSAGVASDSYSGGSYVNGAYADEAYEDIEYDAPASWNGSGATTSANSSVNVSESDLASQNSKNRKLIRNVSMSVETKTFDETTAAIQLKVKDLGGYIEDMNTYNGSNYSKSRQTRSSSMVCRIPKDRTDEFLSMVSENASVVRQSENMRDVTLTYVDLESRKEALETEQRRLLTLMERADYIEEIITIESRLADIRYEIGSMESQLRTYDDKVDYSTVTLDISEVEDYTPVITHTPTTWERISTGFTDSVKDVIDGFKELFIALIIAFPKLVVWAIVIFIIVRIVKAINRKRKQKKEATKQQKQDAKSAETVKTEALEPEKKEKTEPEKKENKK